jgi:hypothetical protein
MHPILNALIGCVLAVLCAVVLSGVLGMLYVLMGG